AIQGYGLLSSVDWAVVGRADPAPGRVLQPGQVVERDAAGPGVGWIVGRTVAPGQVAVATDRDAAGRLPADVAIDVGVYQVEDRQAPVSEGAAEAGPVVGAVHVEHGLGVGEHVLAGPAATERRRLAVRAGLGR